MHRLRSPIVPGIALLAALAIAPRPALGSNVSLSAATFDPLESVPATAAALSLPDRPAGVHPYIIQFAHPVEARDAAALEAIGVEVVGYLPSDAYLARIAREVVASAAAMPGVRWVGLFQPAWRLSPAIGTTELLDPARKDRAILSLRVRVFDDPASAARRFQTLGARTRDWFDDGFQRVVRLDAGAELLPALARDPSTWWIEEEPEFRVWNNTTRWVIQSNQSGLTPIWDHGLHGEGELVSVMDTGIDYNSCFFRDTGNAPPGPSHRKVVSYTNWGGNTRDGCGTGHGTHVCGTVAGDQSFINPGDFNYNGMAYGAKLAVQDVGADDFFSCLLGLLSIPGTLTGAYDEAYSLGARIHTNSWGSTANAYDTYCVNVDQYMWSHPDFLILFANGNSGPSGSTVSSPATAKNCVSVGATDQAPNQNNVASYSSRGPTSDQRFKPTLTTPGGQDPRFIVSADNNTGGPPTPTCNTQGSPFQGTSMATPAAAGAAALVRQYFASGFYPLGTVGSSAPLVPTAAVIKALLLNAGTDMGAADIPNNNEGWGRLRLDDALYFDGDSRELRVEAGDPLSTGGVISFNYNVDSSDEPLEVSLVWTDYPATNGAGVTLVDDLDLLVTAPGGAQYRGNVFAGGQSTTGGTPDRRNVEEVVLLNAPVLGTYTIEVRGFNVPRAEGQPFALVSTGAFGNWPEETSAVDTGLAAGGWSLLAVEPSPSTGKTMLRFAAPGAAFATLRVVGVDGRTIRTLVEGRVDAGESNATWDGRDSAGRMVPSGIYHAVLTSERAELSRRIVILH